MFDIIVEEIKKVLKSRILPIAIVFILLFCLLIHKLFVLQIINGQQIASEENETNGKLREIKSTRGNFYDCKGRLLATNELSYSVILEDTTQINSNEQRNSIIYRLIKLIESTGETVDVEFPLICNKQGKLEFTVEEGDDRNRFLKLAYQYLDKEDKEKLMDVTPEEFYGFLKNGTIDVKLKYYAPTMFEISDEYSVEDTLKIMAVRYALFCNYPKYLPITIASDVKDETVAAVMEESADLIGVDVQQQAKRVYNDSVYFAQILGYTGLINADQMKEYNKDKEIYNSSDVIGKSGLENKFEKYLAGKKGLETLATDSSGKVINVEKRVEPVAGSDVYLTIDSELQKQVYQMLEKKIAGILCENIVNSMSYGSKGKSATDIKIPIYEVYFALIDNNAIDITKLNDSKATALEKQVYEKFKNKRKDVFRKMDELLSDRNTLTNNKTGEMEDYLEYFYTALKNEGILLKEKISDEDETFKAYVNNKITLNKFLNYAIANNWVDLEKLDIGKEDYYSSGELYTKLVKATKNILKEDLGFSKLIYRELIFSYELSGTDVCLLLYDQNVLKKDEDEQRLRNGALSSYNFIKNKIKSLKITPAMLALEPCSGSVVVTDVTNGDVKALVSYPGYDNNRLANRIDPEYWNKLLMDQSGALLNRPVQEAIAPGSTFKMITAVAGLEEGVIGLTEKVKDEGVFTKVDPIHPPKCSIYTSSHTTHGYEDVPSALRDSCNYFFYEVGYRLSRNSSGIYKTDLGLKRLKKYATMFGMNKESGLELSEAAPNISTQDPVRSAIGQGNNAYALTQMSKYVTTVANGGKSYNLTLLDKIVTKDNKVVEEKKAKVSKDLTKKIKKSTWDAVHEGMRKVVNESGGSANKTFGNFEKTIAGKTGTAQINPNHPNNALFVSYGPYEKPEISVAVMIPNGYKSTNAAAVAKDVYTVYFKLGDYKKLINGGVEETESDNNVVD